MARLRSQLVSLVFFAAILAGTAGKLKAETDPAQVDEEIQKNLDFFYYMEVIEAQPMLKAFQDELSAPVSPASLKNERKSNRPSKKTRKGNGS